VSRVVTRLRIVASELVTSLGYDRATVTPGMRAGAYWSVDFSDALDDRSTRLALGRNGEESVRVLDGMRRAAALAKRRMRSGATS
jgi:hypothetical protein